MNDVAYARRMLQRAVFLAMMTIYMVASGQTFAGATIDTLGINPPAIFAASDDCVDVCDEEASCDEECIYYPGGPGQWTTCGEYDGGASNGWCDGDTCPEICWEEAHCDWPCYEGGEPTECGLYDGGASNGWCELTCGDGICSWSSPHEEDDVNCPEDCGFCGDDFCAWFFEKPWTCSDDCGGASPGNECDPEEQDCGGGDVCSSGGYCIDQPQCSNCCTDTSQCSGGARCEGFHPDLAGYGWCLQ